MNYRFNFSFLHDWFTANDVTKKEICIAVENKDFTSVNRWINGEQTMPTDSILRFCNYFEVPLECFFLDYDAHSQLDLRAPSVNDQTEPAGGYPKGKKRRGQHGVNPAAPTHRPSVLPYVLITPKENGEVEVEHRELRRDDEERPITVIGIDDVKPETEEQTTSDIHTSAEIHEAEMLQLRLSHQMEINNLMQQFHEREARIRCECERSLETEKEKLYRIIEQQSNTIANFQNMIKEKEAYMADFAECGMVAEHPRK